MQYTKNYNSHQSHSQSNSQKYFVIESSSLSKQLSPVDFIPDRRGKFPLSKNPYYANIKKTEHVLMLARDSMEPLFKRHEGYFRSVTSNFGSFKKTKFHISERFNTPSVSNSWIVMYEIISNFSLIPKIGNTERPWIHFNSENLPCDSILPVFHYVHTICDDNMQFAYNWLNAFPMNDRKYRGKDLYSLASRYQNCTLTKYTDNVRGSCEDVTNIAYIETICSNLNNKTGNADTDSSGERIVNLFTGNIICNVGKLYNNEEYLNNKIFLSQLYLCFRTLVVGGNAVFKNFTFFTKFNISMIAWMRNYFQEFYIYKPESSKTDSAEVFLVCKHFKGVDESQLLFLRNILTSDTFDFRNDTLLKLKKIREQFWIELDAACSMIFGRQSTYINNNIVNFQRLLSNDYMFDRYNNISYKKLQNESRNLFRKKTDQDNEAWYKKYPIYVLHQKKWLNILNITKTHIPDYSQKRTYVKR